MKMTSTEFGLNETTYMQHDLTVFRSGVLINDKVWGWVFRTRITLTIFRIIFPHLKSFVLPICLIVLKWSMGIVRKSHKV